VLYDDAHISNKHLASANNERNLLATTNKCKNQQISVSFSTKKW